MDERFGKSYKLSSKKLIEEVFSKGEKIIRTPIMLRYITTNSELEASFQIAVSVPKRNFKHAVKRNKIKRLIRESVRKNKYIIEEKIPQGGAKFILFLIYTGKQMPDYRKVNDSIESLFHKLPSQKDND